MRKWLIACFLIALFIISILSGFLLNSYLNFSKKPEENKSAVLAEQNNTIVDTSASDIIVSPNATVTTVETFGRCGHVVTSKDIVPREIVNLNEAKVKSFYEGWNVDKFSGNDIVLSRQSEGICNEHYVLRESEGYISISCKNDIGEYIFKGLTDISIQYLPEEDIKSLEKGIEIVGKENLNKFLEDFE